MDPYVEPWSPGIGDPTFMGWLTVVAYFGAAFACVVAHRKRRRAGHAWVWPSLCVLLVLLGINKQLDLQSWFTYVGKRTAIEQGWYEDRRPVQVAFIVTLATVGLVVGLVLLVRLRGALARFRWALAGTVFLIAFIVIRAASFHHVDLFLKLEIAGVRPNWLLELGGIALIGVAALRDAGYLESVARRLPRRRSAKPPPRRKRAEDMGWIDIALELWQRGKSSRPPTKRERPSSSGSSSGHAASTPRKSNAPGPRRERATGRAPTQQNDESGFRVVMAGPPRRKHSK